MRKKLLQALVYCKFRVVNTFRNLAWLIVVLLALILVPQGVWAHRSGCHNLHTCPSDNNSYVCGDLGYPCNGATSLEQINAADVFVPLAVEKAFTNIFGRRPTEAESQYWKKRFRSDKESVYQIRRAMAWHKDYASAGPVPSASITPTRLSKEDLVKNMNTMFASVYGRDHTVSENKYWISRLKDKPTAPALIGAMTHHRDHAIQH